MSKRRCRMASYALLAAFAQIFAGSPAAAQMDFSGYWRQIGQQDSRDNPHIGEIVGLPLTEESIARAETYDQSILSIPEWQCRPHSAAYVKRDPSTLRILPITDPSTRGVVALQAEWYRNVTVPIFLDGRARPPRNAAHTWLGFSTGEWEGEKLRVTTTHIKENWIRRNGPPHSDDIELTEYVIRRRFDNNDYLSWIIIAYDDAYLSEPLIRGQEYEQAFEQQMGVYPCDPVTEVIWPDGYVPHFLPGQNPLFDDFANDYGLPTDIVHQGAATMYPEFRFWLGDAAKSTARPPEGWDDED